MYRLLLNLGLVVGLSASALLPAFAADVKKDAKKIGKNGIYGGRGAEALAVGEEPKETEKVEETEEQRKLNKKYPSSKTGKSKTNQSAHKLALTGIKSYHLTRKLFDEVGKITSSFESDSRLLKVKQSTVLKSRLLPQDLLAYGPDHAYIGLRIRALETEVLPEIRKAISFLGQAKGLAPNIAALQKWHKVAKDTQKVVRYHNKFYKVSIQAAKSNLTQEQLATLAKMWAFNVNPKDAKFLTTMVRTSFLTSLKGEKGKEGVDFESVKTNLPNLDFKISN